MKNKNIISKELFIETINSIENQLKLDWENSDKLSEVYHSYVEPYDNSLLLNQLLSILNYNFGIDKNKCEHGTDIEYFIWELDFGKKYSEGCYSIHGESIPLATAEDLWNLLNRKTNK